MAFLIAGSAARGGAALASGLARRGRDVVLASRRHLQAEADSAEWLGARVRVPECVLGDRPTASSLRDVVARASAVVIVGDAADRAFDLELTLALSDAAAAAPRRPPILRVAALPPGAGADAEAVVVRDGRARLRDFPEGLPEERSVAALEDSDRALLESAATRELRAAVLRSAELVAPGRFAFGPDDVVCRAVLASTHGADPGTALDGASCVDLVDGWSLAKAVESAVERIEALAGEVLHVAGGRNARVTMAEVDDVAERYAERAGPARAWCLDDSRTRVITGAQPTTYARVAITRLRRFATAHRERLAASLPPVPSAIPRTR